MKLGRVKAVPAKPEARSKLRRVAVLGALPSLLLPLALAPARADDPKPVYGPIQEGEEQQIVFDAPPGVPKALVTAAAAATENYPQIRTAEAELRAAGTDVRGAKWQRYPSVSVEALAATRGSQAATRDLIAPNLTIEQPIITFGRISGAIDRAEAVYLVRMSGVNETVRDVALRTIDAYFSVALAARRQAIIETGLAQHRTLVDTISRRVDQEISPHSDLDLAVSRTAQLEQDLALTKAQRETSYVQLVELAGAAAADLGNVPEYDPRVHHPEELGAVERALNCDPTIQRLRAEVLISRADYKIAKASIYPQVSGVFSQSEVTGTRVGVSLRAQTNGGLSQFAAADAAKSRVEGSEFAIATAEREVRQTLRLDFVTNRSSRDRAAANIKAAGSSDEVTESYKRQFIAGRRTWLDVMNAVREGTNYELGVADAEIGAVASSARIWLRTCGWQPRTPLGSLAE